MSTTPISPEDFAAFGSAENYFCKNRENLDKVFVAYLLDGISSDTLKQYALRDGIMPKHFKNPTVQLIWKYALEIFKENPTVEHISPADISEKINAKLPNYKGEDIEKFFEKCFLLSRKMQFKVFEDRICAFIRKAYTYEKCIKQIKEAIENDRKNGNFAILESLAMALYKNMAEYHGVENPRVENVVDEILDRVDHPERDTYLPSPWGEYGFMSTGFRPGLHVIGASPSVGKTSFALELIRFWCKAGKKVAFCSLDMTRDELLKRPIVSETAISTEKIDMHNLTAEEKQRIHAAAEEVKKWPLEISEERDAEKLMGWCQYLMAVQKLDVLVVDFLQLMQCGGITGDNLYTRITAVSGMLKHIAVKLNIPVIALSQLSRKGQVGGRNETERSRIPQMSDLRDSGAIEQDAFTVSLLYVDEEIQQSWEGQGGGLKNYEGEASKDRFWPIDGVKGISAMRPTYLNLVKAQNGRTGQFAFIHYPWAFRWLPTMVNRKKVPGVEDARAREERYFSELRNLPQGRYEDWREKLEEQGAFGPW